MTPMNFSSVILQLFFHTRFISLLSCKTRNPNMLKAMKKWKMVTYACHMVKF